ncbi:MAG TPA: HAMP domain-containing sensor histidine kinase [Cyclobacteriaceae bacterium]|nr:HAMP domain-containing histidine kinase [Cyclobacteriaceae bacterium]HMV88933.1 HAMP domain-containing sensor histidine kinase [Cyclobacteriaceae bacterium]HMX01106.1 HAMP domain-containing sensor histidine kinase [Cyclobacteriaceae bacterium]HMX51922.1 HAMP domain-containing sensor histidine kinase [Cyclobacteriaceae bacterium]HMY91908.1 HAMP domain-containing sensor histidine kinase [Cyclobacteriaceae bacterium]
MFKLFEINSIRSRMVASFLFLTSLILVLAIVSLYTLDRTLQIARINTDVNQLEIFTLNLIKTDNDFFNVEMINKRYFETHSSSFLSRRDSLNHRIQTKISDLKKQGINKAYTIDYTLHSIDSTLSLYNSKFNTLETLLFRKGFKDYGLEGKMREHAHKLEEANLGIDIAKILYLRRHEKDFFLRHDTTYLVAFKKRASALFEELNKSHQKNSEAIFHIKEYQRLFLELAEIQIMVGLSSEAGLRNELNVLTQYLSDRFFSLSEYAYRQSSAAQNHARIVYISALGIGILISILTGYWISRRLSEPITKLSRLVNSSQKSNFAVDLNLKNAAHEIITLTASFSRLMGKTEDQMREIKLKSKQLKQRNKQLRKLNKEQDHFLYSTAHDLRSPLTSLAGLVNLMRIENKAPEMIHYFDKMEKSISRQEDFIEQIASFSKNKILKIKPEPLDLEKIFNETFEHHLYMAGAARIKQEVIVDNPQKVSIYSDYNRMLVLFNNLISNGIRYADPEKPVSFIKVHITVRRNELMLKFSDNGIGISQQHLNRIFDMFYRAHDDSKGTGLGLFILQETVRKMNGSVQVESTSGVGTVFTLTLPNLQTARVSQLALT